MTTLHPAPRLARLSVSLPFQIALVLAAFASDASAATRHVRADAPPGGDGTSWATASNDLRSTLVAAQPGDDLFVARGVYKPTTGTDQNLRFSVPSGVKIYGGFMGTEASIGERPADPDPDSADPLFDTILSGEIGVAGFTDNTFNVLDLEFCTNATLVDRLVVTRGIPAPSFPRNRGGGLRIAGGSPVIATCLIIDNSGSEGAGAFLLFGSVPTLIDCTFRANIAASAGGLLVQTSNPIFDGCRFIDNQSTSFSGGAISYVFTSGGEVKNCLFERNTTGNNGGAIDCVITSSPRISDCMFIDNATPLTSGGGGALSFNGGAPIIERCTFRGNQGRQGGAVQDQSGAAVFTDCVFEMNASEFGGATYASGASSFTRCTFADNTSTTAGGMIVYGFPILTDCQFLNNIATHTGTGGGGIYIAGSPTIIGCLFQGNRAQVGAGVYLAGSPTFSRCTFAHNIAAASGGAIFGLSGSSLTAVNSLFTGNTCSIFGNAAYFSGNTTASFDNCTIAGNSGGVQAIFTGGAMSIENSIVRNAGVELQGNAAVMYTNVEGDAPGTGNIDTDPLFTNPAMDDYSLLSASPCIDAGNNTLVPAGTTADLASAARFVDDPLAPDSGVGPAPVVDMGALEVQAAPPPCPGDANHDGVVNFADITNVLSNFGLSGPDGDANNDGMVNFSDVTNVLSNWNLPCP